MNKIFLRSTAVTIILVSAFFFGCNDDSDIGLGIIPKDRLIVMGTSDTISIEAYTYPVDSIITSSTASVLLGSYDDPIFGKVQAGFVLQITPGATAGFGTDAIADSMVLSLRYNTDSLVPIYGNQSATMNFLAQEIKTKLYQDSIYYSNYREEWLNLSEVVIDTTFAPEDGRNDTAVLNVHLNKIFAQRIVDDYHEWHDDVSPTDTSFYDYFNGMYIKSNDIPYDGSISTFNIFDSYSKVVLYYHNSTDTLELSFFISQASTRFNLFNHVHDAVGFLPDLDNPEVKQDSVVYLQGLGGLKVKIKIPELDQIKEDGRWGVNRAELVIPAENNLLTEESKYPAPLKTNLYGVNSDGDLLFLDDYIGSTGYLGVNYEENNYIFDVTYHIQQILSGVVENNGFDLFPVANYVNPSRVALTGPKHSNKMKLILTLRKLD